MNVAAKNTLLNRHLILASYVNFGGKKKLTAIERL
jgi:hypothetical protein